MTTAISIKDIILQTGDGPDMVPPNGKKVALQFKTNMGRDIAAVWWTPLGEVQNLKFFEHLQVDTVINSDQINIDVAAAKGPNHLFSMTIRVYLLMI